MNEETKNRLKDLLSLYANDEADESFIRSAISIAVTGMGLENYVTKVVYIPTYEHLNPIYEEYTKGIAGFFGQAAYVPKKRELVIYERNLLYSKEMAANSEHITNERNLFIKLLILQTIFHELEHANQKWLTDEGVTIEANFLRSLDKPSMPETTDSYEVSPFERGAELKSWQQIIELAGMLDIESPLVFDAFKKAQGDEILRGYNFKFEDDYINGSPIKQYMAKRGIDEDTVLPFLEELPEDLYDIYGCPIPFHELEAKAGKKANLLL